MAKFRVTLYYNASFSSVVEAIDEGAALEQVRNMAEVDADMKQFNIGVEKESFCDRIE